MGRGIWSTLTQTRISGRFSASSRTLPTYSEAISAHTRSGDFSNSCGPGCRLKIWNAASITAAVAEVGMPKVSSGTSTPENDALFAASGPATPSIAPLPNSSLFLARCFSYVYDRKVGSSAPPAGSAPNGKPKAVPRSHGRQERCQSYRLSQERQQDGGDGRGDERPDGGGRERGSGATAPGHLVPLDRGRHRGGLAGCVEQDRGRRPAVHRAVVDAGEHDERSDRIVQVECDGQQQRDGQGGPDARQDPDQRADRDADRGEQQVLRAQDRREPVHEVAQHVHSGTTPAGRLMSSSRVKARYTASTSSTAVITSRSRWWLPRIRAATMKNSALASTKPSGSRANTYPTSATTTSVGVSHPIPRGSPRSSASVSSVGSSACGATSWRTR